MGLQSIVGEGSYGVVYRAIPYGLGCFYPLSPTRYAIKRPHDTIRLQKEWKNMMHLQRIDPTGTYHTPLLGGCYTKANQLIGLVLPLALYDLSVVLADHTRPAVIVSDMLHDIYRALSFFHQNGLAHGDVKPDNILIFPHDRALLSDWEGMVDLTHPGSTTCTYLPPSVHRKRSLLTIQDTWPVVDRFAWLLMAVVLSDQQRLCFHSRASVAERDRQPSIIQIIQGHIDSTQYPYPDLKKRCLLILKTIDPEGVRSRSFRRHSRPITGHAAPVSTSPSEVSSRPPQTRFLGTPSSDTQTSSRSASTPPHDLITLLQHVIQPFLPQPAAHPTPPHPHSQEYTL